jgi:hypothetical protein
MMILRPNPPLVLALALLLSSCSKTGGTDRAQVKEEFSRICQAQKEFLEARQLKGVNEAELAVERNLRMRSGTMTEPALRLIDLLGESPAEERAKLAEGAAKEAGLKGWSCPELGQGP